jgi:hypothetical protein
MNSPTLPPWLTDDEIHDICDGLTQNAAQVRYLRETLGLTVRIKPNGRPLVLRADIDALTSAQPLPAAVRPIRSEPNRLALINSFRTS